MLIFLIIKYYIKQLFCRFHTRLFFYYQIYYLNNRMQNILGICNILPLRPMFNKVYIDNDAD